jgi:hypothetical protein
VWSAERVTFVHVTGDFVSVLTGPLEDTIDLSSAMIELLGWCGALVVLLSLTQRDHARLHVFNIVACLLFVVYDVALSLTSMLAMNIVLLCISVKQIHWHRSRRIVEVEPAGSVLSASS